MQGGSDNKFDAVIPWVKRVLKIQKALRLMEGHSLVPKPFVGKAA